jgi:hypothetical protein
VSHAPSAHPSLAPSVAAEPTPAPLYTIAFSATVLVHNVDSAAETDSASINALRLTVQDAIVGLPLEDISVIEMTGAVTTLDSTAALQSYDVMYGISTAYEKLGFENADSAYWSMTTDLTMSVNSSQFSTNLLDNANALSAAPLYGASVPITQVVSYTDYTVIVNAKEGNVFDLNIYWGTIALYIFFGLSTVVTVSVFLYYSYVGSKRIKSKPLNRIKSGGSVITHDVGRITFTKNIMHNDREGTNQDNSFKVGVRVDDNL